MFRSVPRILIAALRGGSGKTTLSLGILRAFKKRGFSVVPFKKGPDYIDPFWHKEASGVSSHNLDPYLMGKNQVLRAFGYYTRGSSAALIEGNRGLFDGMGIDEGFSTAELAKWLQSPVILVVDCSMASRTIAALVLGCKKFDLNLNLAGVILNPVANLRQEKVIKKAIKKYTGVDVIGAIPRLNLEFSERHMGLIPPQERNDVSVLIEQIEENIASYVDLDYIWKIMNSAPNWEEVSLPEGLFPSSFISKNKPVIGVVRDSVFDFYYSDNLEALLNHGAQLVYFSSLENAEISSIDMLYIGGGFPEVYLSYLVANKTFRSSIYKASKKGLPIYAECGGLMFLGENVILGRNKYPMVGIFPIDFLMKSKPQGHGYTLCHVISKNPFMPLGYKFRAHEFHYSFPILKEGSMFGFVYQIERGKGILNSRCGILSNQVLGTYHHIHCLSATEWAPGLVKAAERGW